MNLNDYIRIKAGRGFTWFKRRIEPKWNIDNKEFLRVKNEYEKVKMGLFKMEMDTIGVNEKNLPFGYEIKKEVKEKLEFLRKFDKELEKAILEDKELINYFGGVNGFYELLRLNENIRTMIECNLINSSNPYTRYKVMRLMVNLFNKLKKGGE
ncbi:MAG: hypothetical protein QXY18_05765 [Nitrososphaerota archaeon]